MHWVTMSIKGNNMMVNLALAAIAGDIEIAL